MARGDIRIGLERWDSLTTGSVRVEMTIRKLVQWTLLTWEALVDGDLTRCCVTNWLGGTWVMALVGLLGVVSKGVSLLQIVGLLLQYVGIQ